MSRTVKIFFTVSLLLNVLLLGVAGGYVYDDVRRAVFEEHRAEKMRQHPDLAERNKEFVRALAAARLRGAELLLAEPFDRESYVRHLQDIEALQIRMTQEKWQRLRDESATLTAAQRALLAERMKFLARNPHAARLKP